MRITFQTEVRGATELAVLRAARTQWGNYIGDPDAELPTGASIYVEPEIEQKSMGDFNPVSVVYVAQVKIVRQVMNGSIE